MKLGKNVKVNFAGKTFRGEIPDQIAEKLGLKAEDLAAMQKSFDSKKTAADAINAKNDKAQAVKQSARVAEKTKRLAEAKAELAKSKQPDSVKIAEPKKIEILDKKVKK